MRHTGEGLTRLTLGDGAPDPDDAGEHAVLKYKGIPPYQETQAYVRRIKSDRAPALDLALKRFNDADSFRLPTSLRSLVSSRNCNMLFLSSSLGFTLSRPHLAYSGPRRCYRGDFG
jgi:hypothetical protein